MQNNDAVTKTFTPEETAAWWAGLEKRMSSADVLCETTDGRLLIVKASYKTHWSLPGGIIDAGETPLAAAIRELAEETGVEINPTDTSFVAVIDRRSDKFHSYQFLFRSILPDEMIENISTKAGEIADWALVTKDEVHSNNRQYEQVISHWADGDSAPYREQQFIIDKD